MNFTTEITSGSIAVCLTIVGMGVTSLVTLLTVYIKTRGDIETLKGSHTDLKTDIAKIETKVEVQAANTQTILLHLERISAKQELMQTIVNLPNDLAAAIGKLAQHDRGRDRSNA